MKGQEGAATTYHLDAGETRLAVEIPADYQAVKAADPELALAWRLATRQALEACFAAGYLVVEMAGERSAGGRAYYILQRDEASSQQFG